MAFAFFWQARYNCGVLQEAYPGHISGCEANIELSSGGNIPLYQASLKRDIDAQIKEPDGYALFFYRYGGVEREDGGRIWLYKPFPLLEMGKNWAVVREIPYPPEIVAVFEKMDLFGEVVGNILIPCILNTVPSSGFTKNGKEQALEAKTDSPCPPRPTIRSGNAGGAFCPE